ncbi:hypothetical protein MKX01_032029 [Papaver californicum]|nr:hypothetical protein MKX01_032029 [Papaver californicum]
MIANVVGFSSKQTDLITKANTICPLVASEGIDFKFEEALLPVLIGQSACRRGWFLATDADELFNYEDEVWDSILSHPKVNQQYFIGVNMFRCLLFYDDLYYLFLNFIFT